MTPTVQYSVTSTGEIQARCIEFDECAAAEKTLRQARTQVIAWLSLYGFPKINEEFVPSVANPLWLG